VLTPHAVSAEEARRALECPVCLCRFASLESGVVHLKCRHVFHADCLGPWFKEHHTCPVCRTDIDEGA
jgi:E3 ubiquitin-protein ligase ATL6/9/15/31/42/55